MAMGEGIGTDDGQYYEDRLDYLMSTARGASTMPPQAPEKPAGAFKSTGGSETPARGALDKLLGISGERYQLWPEKAVRSVIGGMALPGDVYQGKVAPDSVEAVERAADLASFAVLGPAPLAKKMADGTLGSFAGVKSKTLDKGALEVAQTAEREGLSPDEIWNKTGFFKGADKRWRYEIDDSSSTWKPPDMSVSNATLGKHLDHPELYKAYPELKNVKVFVDPYYSSNSAAWDGSMIRMGDRASQDKGVLMHEVTHAIQDIEAFAQGGQPGKGGKDYKLRYEDSVDALRKEYINLQRFSKEKPVWTPEEQKRLDYLRQVFSKYVEYARAGDVKARENYLALAGETEARNVQTRVDLEPKDRWSIGPLRTEDVMRKDQIVSSTPIYTTPYTGSSNELQAILNNRKSSAASEPSTFRRAANDNIKTEKLPNPELEALEAFTRKSETINKLYEDRAKLHEIRRTRDWSEVDLARYNKIGKEINKTVGEDHVQPLTAPLKKYEYAKDLDALIKEFEAVFSKIEK